MTRCSITFPFRGYDKARHMRLTRTATEPLRTIRPTRNAACMGNKLYRRTLEISWKRRRYYWFFDVLSRCLWDAPCKRRYFPLPSHDRPSYRTIFVRRRRLSFRVLMKPVSESLLVRPGRPNGRRSAPRVRGFSNVHLHDQAGSVSDPASSLFRPHLPLTDSSSPERVPRFSGAAARASATIPTLGVPYGFFCFARDLRFNGGWGVGRSGSSPTSSPVVTACVARHVRAPCVGREHRWPRQARKHDN